MLRDSRVALERSRALLVRAAAKAPRSTPATDGTVPERASGITAETGRMRHIPANP